MFTEIEHQLLESAKRAQNQCNDTWELDVLRIHALIREVVETKTAEPTVQSTGSERFKLVRGNTPRSGGMLFFDNATIPLTTGEVRVMQHLISPPNTVVNRDQLVGSGRGSSDRTLQASLDGLKSKLGENSIVVAKGKVVFLPNGLGSRNETT